MVLFLRKRWIFSCITLILSALTLVSVVHIPDTIGVSSMQTVSMNTAPVFVLDAGHGGADGGAVSTDGVYESDINLAIIRCMWDVLSLLGCDTVLTRTDGQSLADDPAASIRQQKVSDTKNRVALINSIDRATLISIHQNILPGYASVHGAQVFYSASERSAEVAETIQQTLNRVINKDNSKNKKPISADVYLMRHVTCPAVLVECGFLSNSAETERLQDPNYQTLLAMTICCSATEG